MGEEIMIKEAIGTLVKGLSLTVDEAAGVMNEIMEDEIFPSKRTFKSYSEDVFKKILIDKPIDWFSSILKKIAVMQTGQIQHYILYAFVFILFIFLLTYFNFI